MANWLGRRVAERRGAALVVDYGYTREAHGDTLQALKNHRRADVLCDPGEADVTAHVDFAALAQRRGSKQAREFTGQSSKDLFLRALGIEVRAECLMAASPAKAATVAAGLRRLTDPQAMGSLFKVMAIADPALPMLAGFA